MNPISRQTIVDSIRLNGFENWRPDVDVPHLDRPQTRPEHLPGDGRLAAVLVLLFPLANFDVAAYQDDRLDCFTQSSSDIGIVFTKRPVSMSNHGGQISLPGGKQEPDETLEQTALRETFEEIGINDADVEILGRLNSVYIPPSDFSMYPYVGWTGKNPAFVRDRHEVDTLIVTSLETLMSDSIFQVGTINSRGRELHEIPFYQLSNHQVWGSTAIVVGELLARISEIIR